MGYVLDTVLNYLATKPASGGTTSTTTLADDFATKASDVYERMRIPPDLKPPNPKNPKNPKRWPAFANACWRDDYGWMTVAVQRAAQQPFFSDTQKNRFKTIADEAWGLMYPDATKAWPPDEGRAWFASLQPRFPGGVWNYDWFDKVKTPFKSDTACNWYLNQDQTTYTPCDPTVPTDLFFTDPKAIDGVLILCGRQNTVTNALYWMAASRFSAQGQFNAAATGANAFFRSWFAFDQPCRSSPCLSLLNRDIGKGRALVRERVSSFSDGGMDNAYRPDLAWAGDQGLVLGGLLAQINALPPNSAERATLLKTALDITDGVGHYLARKEVKADPTKPAFVDCDLHQGTATATSVPVLPPCDRLLPWRDPKTETEKSPFIGIGYPPGADSWDHNLGTGVWLDYLVQAYKTNPSVREHLRAAGWPEFLWRLANDPLDPTSPCVGICPPHTPNSTKLALLVAAIEMNKDKANTPVPTSTTAVPSRPGA